MVTKHGVSVTGKLEDAISNIVDEYYRATNKFEKFNSSHEGYAVVLEKLDEAWDEIKANRIPEAKYEMLQVAAMAIRFLIDVEA